MDFPLLFIIVVSVIFIFICVIGCVVLTIACVRRLKMKQSNYVRMESAKRSVEFVNGNFSDDGSGVESFHNGYFGFEDEMNKT